MLGRHSTTNIHLEAGLCDELSRVWLSFLIKLLVIATVQYGGTWNLYYPCLVYETGGACVDFHIFFLCICTL